MRHFRFVRWVNAGVLFAICATVALSQDVVVAPMAWVEQEDPPDQLPTLRRALRPDFPSELRKTEDIGWGTLEVWLDERGKVTRGDIHATQPAYARALRLERGGTYKPGRRKGKPVNTHVRLAVVFNPASASVTACDATVRLLDATTVVDSRRKPVRAHTTESEREVVWVTANINRQGEFTGFEDVPDDMRDLLLACVRQWRFAPARRAGEPVDAQVRLPFVVLPPEEPLPTDRTPPKVVFRAPPVYPLGLRRQGMRGEVVVEFVIDPEGSVKNPIVVRTLHPAFNEAALAAIRQWRFEPGRVAGRPVNTLMQQAISFSLEGEPDGGNSGIEVRRRADLSKLPEQLRYDTAPRIETTVLPRYPYALLRKGTHGVAQVSMMIDTRGEVVATRIERASHPEFGFALQAAAQGFKYRPALKHGQPCPSFISFEQEFSPDDEALVSAADRAALDLERKHPERLLTASKLDKSLKPGVAKSPAFPRAVADSVNEGEATIEMLIDKEGRVCLPRVVSASEPAFGYAAVQAVGEWRFDVPTSQGKPGAVRVVVPFKFKRPPSAPATPAHP
jgi:TonB family protein